MMVESELYKDRANYYKIIVSRIQLGGSSSHIRSIGFLVASLASPWAAELASRFTCPTFQLLRDLNAIRISSMICPYRTQLGLYS